MNGLFHKTFFKKIVLIILLVSFISEPIFTTSSTVTVYASTVTSNETSDTDTNSLLGETANDTSATTQASTTDDNSNIYDVDLSDTSEETSTVVKTDSGTSKTDTSASESDTNTSETDTSASESDTNTSKTDTSASESDTNTSKTDTSASESDTNTSKTDTSISESDTTDTTTTNIDSTHTKEETTDLEISEQIFPDEIFRTFVINHFDTDKNKKLSSDEISKIENIDLSNMGIEDLSGIEHFTNINYLYCSGNKLKSLNLGTLTNMTVLNCSFNYLTSLDLSKCSSLISFECKNNGFAISLDENNTFDLSSIKELVIENTSNWSDNVVINETKLTPTKESIRNLITYDYLVNAPLIKDTYINFSLVVAPTTLDDVEINETTFPDNPFREYISTSFDKDKNLILTRDELNEVTYLFVPSKEISVLTGMAYFPNLIYLNCEDNAISSIDLKSLSNLRGIYASNNHLTQILFDDSVKLEELYCSNNELSNLDTRLLCNLTKLYCDNNLLTTLDTLTLTNLVELNCSNNKLYSLDLTTCAALEVLECNDNVSEATIDANNKLDLSSYTLLDLAKTFNWSTGTLNSDNTMVLDSYTDGMAITYTYLVSAPNNVGQEVTFTISPKLAETLTVQPELASVEVTAPDAAITADTTIATETTITPETSSIPAVTTAPTIVNYSVSFNTDGGNAIDSQSIPTGNKAVTPSNPAKPGCLFDGWYVGDSKFDFNTTISSDTNLIAHWSIVSSPKPTIKSIKNSKKAQMKITLKVSENIAGYEISYSTNKNASKNAIILETQKTSVTIKNLVLGKTYYVRVRTFNLDSTGGKIYSDYSKIKSVKIEKGLNEVKATSTSATIKSCKITSGSTVSVAVKTNDIIKSNDNYYYLFQLSSYKKSISKSATPLAQAIKGTSLTFETPLNLNSSASLLYSKFVVAIKVKSGYKIISKAKYITNPQDIATFTYSFPQAQTKKGLQINASMLNDVNDLGVKNSAFNIPLEMIIAAPGENNYRSGIEYEYNGETYWFRKGMISAYDSLFRKLERQDIVVTAIVLLGWRDDLTYLISPSGREEGHNYYNFNTSDSDARKQLEATFSFLAERYASDDGNGKVVNWIIGNEINSFDAWNYAGTSSLSKHTQLYADSYRLAYTAITSVYSNARLYISLDQCWNTSNSTTFSAKEFLTEFASNIKEYGNIKWNIAYHAYPSPLTNPRFWKNANGLSQNNADSPVISIYNIKVLTDYVKKHYGSDTRIILSEQGFTSAQPYGEKVQAAAMAYSYYLAEFNPMIDAFILSRHVDNVAETKDGLNLGLWTNTPGQVEEAYQKKYAWNVYKYMDTPSSTQVTKFALKIIGASSWKKIIPKYKANKFNTMPEAD